MVENKPDIVGYLSGPVDAREVYDRWLHSEPTAYFGTSYLQQFFTTVTELGARGHVLTCHGGERYDIDYGNFVISNRPREWTIPGWRFHLSEAGWIRSALQTLHSNRARVVVLTDAQSYWALTFGFRFRGMKFINGLHCALRPAFKVEPLHSRLLLWATGRLHYAFGDAALSASPIIDRQLDTMPGNGKREITRFLPTYGTQDFANISLPAKRPGGRMTILYAGRIERYKGVFDLLRTAELLKARHGDGVVDFDICGDGSQLAALKTAAENRGLAESFRVHGFCGRDELSKYFSSSDVVVVPTRTDFEEGFAMIVAEGVIAGRPVITSRVCPALEVVGPACLEVEPDDPQNYADAISSLLSDNHLFEEKQQAASTLRAQFFDLRNSYGENLKPILKKLLAR